MIVEDIFINVIFKCNSRQFEINCLINITLEHCFNYELQKTSKISGKFLINSCFHIVMYVGGQKKCNGEVFLTHFQTQFKSRLLSKFIAFHQK